MDYATLKGLSLSRFEKAADGYRTTSDMASQAKDRIDEQIAAKLRNALEGEAANAALRQLRELSKNFHYAQIECGLVSTALNGLVFDLRAARKKLDAAVEDARSDKFTVGADGSVAYPAAGEKVDGRTPKGGTATGTTDKMASALYEQAAQLHPNPNYARAQAYANRIAAAVREAAEADRKWAPKLRKLKADDDLTVSHADWDDVRRDMQGVRKGAGEYLEGIKAPPKEGSPEENAEWWKGLSDEERADYVSLHPATVGALDGLPAEVRDEANRTVLAEKRGQYELELKSIPPEPKRYMVNPMGSYPAVMETPEWRKWNAEYGDRREHLEKSLKGMRAIQARFGRTGEGGLPEAYLLGFDPVGRGDGRIILANGNPDTADHTAVYVPGTTTRLETIGAGKDFGDLGRTERLWEESNRFSPNEKISTIMWFDYNAPDKVLFQATSGSYAEEGGPVLHQFLHGTRTSHEYATGGSSHTTLIGHSYGTTVIGEATQAGNWRDGPMADEIVVAGSPGMQVRRASDLGIDPDHMWAMGGPGNDQIVRQGGRFVGLGDNWIIPTDKSFGGNIMKSDSDGHSGFWDAESLSLRNQAAVITGKHHRVELD
ncbi:MAG TPA: alpha/beta hydrolase [Streptomyces sp.]|nr:alpha/beta hydrolase [Streptomyces sp.]